MMVNRQLGSMLELQAIADICFSVVECYATRDFCVPVHTILPLRFAEVPECPGRIRLWIQDHHCMAIVDPASEELIQHLFDDSEGE